jgi:hypothetical protein
METDLVVAVYQEPVEWIRTLPAQRVFVYLKDPSRLSTVRDKLPTAHIEVLPNLGRESHTYLHHIQTAYDTLGSHTLFLQGNPFDHCSLSDIQTLLESPRSPFASLGYSCSCDGLGYPDHPELPVSRCFQRYIGGDRTAFTFDAGAQFLVAREQIQRHPLEFYTALYTAHSVEPLFPWCMERYWPYMFAE